MAAYVSAHPAHDRLMKKLREADVDSVDAVMSGLSVEDYHFQRGRHDAFQEAMGLAQEAHKAWLSGDDEDGQES